MSAATPPRSATVVIVTKDRRVSLLDAVASAVAQEGDVEVLVVDDGSRDGTADAVAAAFPSVCVHRFETSAGLVVRRNDAARLAHGDIVVSMDDDAVFTATSTVAQTLADFDHSRIAAVAMPYADVRRSPEVHQQPPDGDGRWIAPVFRGTAHAIRREVFLGMEGYRERIVHQGEEHDFCLRLLDAGLYVRLGRGAPIHHLESPRRSFRRMERYGRRNEQLLCKTYLPRPWSWIYGVGYAGKNILRCARGQGAFVWMVEGLLHGVAVWLSPSNRRHPIARTTFSLDRRLRRAGSLPLEDVLAVQPTSLLPAPPPV